MCRYTEALSLKVVLVSALASVYISVALKPEKQKVMDVRNKNPSGCHPQISVRFLLKSKGNFFIISFSRIVDSSETKSWNISWRNFIKTDNERGGRRGKVGITLTFPSVWEFLLSTFSVRGKIKYKINKHEICAPRETLERLAFWLIIPSLAAVAVSDLPFNDELQVMTELYTAPNELAQ